MCALVVSLVEAKNAAMETAVDFANRMPARPMMLRRNEVAEPPHHVGGE